MPLSLTCPTSRPYRAGVKNPLAPRGGKAWSRLRRHRIIAAVDSYSPLCHYSVVKEPDVPADRRKRISPLGKMPFAQSASAALAFSTANEAWWSRWDSNPRPPGCKPGALPTELRPPRNCGLQVPDSAARGQARRAVCFSIRNSKSAMDLVGPGGFEPPTSPLSGARSSQLSYEPSVYAEFRMRSAESASACVETPGHSTLFIPHSALHIPHGRGRSTVRAEAGRECADIPSPWGRYLGLPRKEVIQPQVPLRLPCYDLVPVTRFTVGASLPCGLGRRLRVLPASVA